MPHVDLYSVLHSQASPSRLRNQGSPALVRDPLSIYWQGDTLTRISPPL